MIVTLHGNLIMKTTDMDSPLAIGRGLDQLWLAARMLQEPRKPPLHRQGYPLRQAEAHLARAGPQQG